MYFATESEFTRGKIESERSSMDSRYSDRFDLAPAYLGTNTIVGNRQVSMAHLSLLLLGPFRASVDEEALSISRAKKIEALLAYLALEADRPHARTTLDGLLFPEMPEETARTNLRQTVARLRSAIRDADASPSFLLLAPDTIQFNSASDFDLDVLTFRSKLNGCAIHHGRRSDDCSDCMREVQEAVRLYRGPFCDEFFIRDSEAFEAWLQHVREQLHQEAMTALRSLAGYYERRGEYDQALGIARRQLELEAWREEVHRQVMRLLARQGQRSAALQQYERCREVLREELAVEPSEETLALYQRIRVATDVRAHNLPDLLTSFIGREEELAQISLQLSDSEKRLVTLVGLGGIGKTRLALQTAQRVASDHLGPYMDGVFFAPLAGIHSTHALISAIADALQMSFSGATEPLEQLNKHLREKELLLVLDNFEQLNESAVEVLTSILQHTQHVHLLITSRDRLKLKEEWVIQIEGLSFPEEEALDSRLWTIEDAAQRVAALENYSALVLFTERARQIVFNFDLLEDADEARAVARICRFVEGLPLGIELAAAWVNVLSCGEIAQELQRIGHALDLLETSNRNVIDRHRSIRTAFEHSWNLLDALEQKMLARLTVFQGKFTSDAAMHVTQIAAPVASLRILSALADKSLVRRSQAGRLDLHELVCQFAAEKLAADAAEEKAARERHATYYGIILHKSEMYLEGDQELEILNQIRAEIQNVRTGWDWAATHSNETLLDQYLVSLYDFYTTANRYQEGRDAFDLALRNLVDTTRIAESSSNHSIALAKLFSRQAEFYYELGEPDAAIDLLHNSLAILIHHTNDSEAVFAYRMLGAIHHHQGEYAEAKRSLLQSLEVGQAIEDSSARANTYLLLGAVTFALGDYDEAKLWQQKSLGIYKESGKSWGVAHALRALGATAQAQGDHAEAERYLRQSLTLFQEIDNAEGMVLCMSGIGLLAQKRADYVQAKEWYQRSMMLCREHTLLIELVRTLNHLGDVAFLLGEYIEAKDYLRAALEAAISIKATPMALQTLVGVAGLVAQGAAGTKHPADSDDELLTDSLARAYQLLNLVIRHPASSRETRERAQPLLNDVSARLPSRGVETLRESVQIQELETAIDAASVIAGLDSDMLREVILSGDIVIESNAKEENLY